MRWMESRLHNAALAEAEGSLELFHDPAHPGSAVMSVHRDRMKGEAIRVPAVRLSALRHEAGGLPEARRRGKRARRCCAISRSSGAIGQIRQMVIEFHHHMSPGVDNLSECLSILEQHGFGYQLTAGQVYTPITRGQFQDVLVHAYRK